MTTKIADHYTEALTRVRQQFKDKTNFLALLELFCDQVQDVEDGAYPLYKLLDYKNIAGTQSDIEWTNLVNCVVDEDGDVTKTSADGWDQCAVSAQSLTGNGYVEFTITGTSLYVALHNDIPATGEIAGLGDLDYAIRINGTAVFGYEENLNKFTSDEYFVAGDKLKIRIKEGFLYYIHNDKVFGKTAIEGCRTNHDANYPLYLVFMSYGKYTVSDAIIYQDDDNPILDIVGAIVGEDRFGRSDAIYKRYLSARIAANRSDGLVDDVSHVLELALGWTASGYEQLWGIIEPSLAWTAHRHRPNSDGTVITHTTTGAGGGILATEPVYGDAYIEFDFSPTTNICVGFTELLYYNPTSSYVSFSITTSGSSVYITEYAYTTDPSYSFANGDKGKVQILNGEVTYWARARSDTEWTLLHTSTSPLKFPLFPVVSITTQGEQLTGINIVRLDEPTVYITPEPDAGFEAEVREMPVNDLVSDVLAQFVYDAEGVGIRGLLKSSAIDPHDTFTLARFNELDGDHDGSVATELSVYMALAAFDAAGTIVISPGVRPAWWGFPIPDEAFFPGVPASGNLTGVMGTALTAGGTISYQQSFSLPGGDSAVFTENTADAFTSGDNTELDPPAIGSWCYLVIADSDTNPAADRQIIGKRESGGSTLGFELVQNSSDELEFTVVGAGGTRAVSTTPNTILNDGTPFYALCGRSDDEAFAGDTVRLKTSVGDDSTNYSTAGDPGNTAFYSIGAGRLNAHGGGIAIVLYWEGEKASKVWEMFDGWRREYWQWMGLTEDWKYEECEEVIDYTSTDLLRHVVWGSVTNCQDDGNGDLSFTAGAAWSGIGASDRALFGDGYFEFTMDNAGSYVGLTQGADPYYNIRYAFRNNAGTAEIREVGVKIMDVGTFNVNDRYKVEVVEGEVLYWWKPGGTGNWVYVHTSSSSAIGPLNACCGLYGAGNSISNARLYNFRTPITWARMTNCTDNGWGEIQKTGGGAAWDAKGQSTNYLSRNGNFDIIHNGDAGIFGLKGYSTATTNYDQDYAIYISNSTTWLRVYEGGSWVTHTTSGLLPITIQVGDILRIRVVDPWVEYVHIRGDVERIVHRSRTAPTFPLYADASFYVLNEKLAACLYHHEEEENGSFKGVAPALNHVDGEAIAQCDGPGKGLAWGPVEFVDAVGGTIDGNDFTKVAATYAWDEGARSIQCLWSSGYVEIDCEDRDYDTNQGFITFGLSNVDTDATQATIDYGIALGLGNQGGGIRVYESGTIKVQDIPEVVAGDKARVQLEVPQRNYGLVNPLPGIISYWIYRSRLGVWQCIYITKTVPTLPLFFDCSIYWGQATYGGKGVIKNAIICRGNSGLLSTVKEGS